MNSIRTDILLKSFLLYDKKKETSNRKNYISMKVKERKLQFANYVHSLM
jgi:hypothetical protein